MNIVLPDLHRDKDVLAGRISSHWEDMIADKAIEDEPFQHYYIENVWPADVYDKMLELLPPPDLYRALNPKRWVNDKGESTRDVFDFTDSLDKLHGEQGAFWRQVVAAITSRRIKDLMFDKFRRDIALRVNVPPAEVNNVPVHVAITLARDIEDYRLKPHPDGWPRIVTAQFYLPCDNSQEDLGTSLYVRQPLAKRLFGKSFVEVKRMPFRPNSGYAFAVNDCPERKSYHGRELMLSGSGVRNSLLVSWVSTTGGKSKMQPWPLHERL